LVEWADTFQHPEENVKEVVKQLRENPLIPKDVKIHGLMFHPRSGRVELLDRE
jgi:carbonic anhydrase